MRKRSVIGMLGATGIATLSFVLMDKSKRERMMNKWNEWRNTFQTNQSNLPLEAAGDPGKDNLENTDMVAEGSQFGVNYYNKIRK
ncbi:hypothetical protein SAMN04487943_106157 [Gracilibacillus orientalis]|uniref:Uncharacterized protein n=1 Tax=Gracilibacillus orientalis TaxID=334253 RepID=A0A1I4MCJ4_9BACI|nr:hypothetical protein [Gracilibacillus orientalis]SFM00735.1 hypothetical protein SAMN04487943_106157 [Gracilibacillus orientalis]